MKRIVLESEQIITPGESEVGNEEILRIYFEIFNRDDGNYLPPIFVTRNDPRIISDTLEKKVNSKIQTMENPIKDHIKIEEYIEISKDPNERHWTGISFGDLLMRRFDFDGEWAEFRKRYDYGEFSPLYINSSILKIVGETDIVETCRKDNDRLTYKDEVLTKQQYEKAVKEFESSRDTQLKLMLEKEIRPCADIIELSQKLLDQGAEYLLIDGKHRATAATLTHKEIRGFLIKTNKDIEEAISMVKNGEVRDFHHRWEDMRNLKMEFYKFCSSRPEATKTLKDRVDEFVSNREIPEYMIDRYTRKE